MSTKTYILNLVPEFEPKKYPLRMAQLSNCRYIMEMPEGVEIEGAEAIPWPENEDLDLYVVEDHSKDNPVLHMLYVKWAFQDLNVLYGYRDGISNQACTTLINIEAALMNAVNITIYQNVAWRDAKEMIDSVK